MPSMSTVAVGAKVTATNENTEIGWINAMGLIGIIPTSVAGTGVALAAAGKVTFSAATSISINGCFTATYDNYLILIDVASVSTSLQLGGRLRLAGTDASGASDYGSQSLTSTGATTTSASSGATSSFQASPGAAGSVRAELKMYSPALARKTGFVTTGIGANSAATLGLTTVGGTHELTVAYDGITFIPSAGNATGTIRVYAYNNLG